MPSRQINVAILGFGTVGSGTYKVLTAHADEIERRTGCRISVSKVADLDWNRPRTILPDESIRTTDAMAAVTDPSIDIVVETIGGVKAARELVLAAIEHGKGVATSNKVLMARHGGEILDLAKERGVDVFFEGAVAGGIPLIRPLKESLEANEIRQIMGILNGTTNYILTRMTRDGAEFDNALAEAQVQGYAEADPTDDVEGHDAAYKIAILAAIAFGSRVPVDEVYREGITGITQADIRYAREMERVVKLLAVAKRDGDAIQVRVHPTLLPKRHPLASVNDVFNAVWIEGDAMGEVMFYGRGAGSMPTGSAVASDVIDIARNIARGAMARYSCTCSHQYPPQDIGQVVTKYYLRTTVADQPGVLGQMATILGRHDVSIESVIQKGTSGHVAEVVWLTHPVTGYDILHAVEHLRSLSVVKSVDSMIRVEGN